LRVKNLPRLELSKVFSETISLSVAKSRMTFVLSLL
jgi:hypothetical protein